ncbi:MlaD family protein [Elioraea thermophila]|uniref:MlaD family protein n=1 Tax=Elioraea thermophila TaxID=2185104 RepID=UPI0013004F49|nr:MlaD family protein [Elioraea thermophila]
MSGPARFSRTNEIAGAVVLAALVLFVAAVLQAGVLGPLLRPALTLRVILPPEGTAGLSAGAAVEVLGTRAGQVRRIVIDPRAQLYADVRLDKGMDVFVRRDSRVFIRRQFGVAGAAFLEITRGSGEPLDWDYAVLEVTREQAPTESLGELIEDLRARLVPVFEDVATITRAAAVISDRLARGEGAVGRLLADDTLVRELETAAAQLDRTLAQGEAAVADLRGVVRSAGAAAEGLPRLIAAAEGALANLRSATGDLARASPQAPRLARDAAAAVAVLPGLLVQVQQATAELERLVVALRTHPLIGGGRPPEEEPRVPARDIRP